MVSTTTKATGITQDRTEKLGITLPKSILQKLMISVEIFLEAHTFEELLKVFLISKPKKEPEENRWLL